MARSGLVAPSGLERAVGLAARMCGPHDGILVLLDADDDRPTEFAVELARRALTQRSDRKIRVVRAKRAFESGFLAGARSLAGVRGLAEDLTPPDDLDSIRDARGRLSDRMRARRPGGYRETPDQPAMAAMFDLDAARTDGPSFDQLWGDVVGLLTAAAGRSDS